MRGLLLLLILALVVIAIDHGGVRFPTLSIESNATGLSNYASNRTTYRRTYSSYRYTRYRSSRSWERSPLADYEDFQARLSEGGDLLELSADNLVSGITNHDWDRLKRGKSNALAAKRALSDAFELLRSME